MNREQKRKHEKIFRQRMKTQDFKAKDSIYDLKRGDILEIKERIWFMSMNGIPIRYIEAKEQIIYLRKANNPNSLIKKWLVCRDKNGIEGLLIPNGMINNFKIIGEK